MEVAQQIANHESTASTIAARGREPADSRASVEAKLVGANAVIATRFSTSYVAGNMAEILAYGTADVVDDESTG